MGARASASFPLKRLQGTGVWRSAPIGVGSFSKIDIDMSRLEAWLFLGVGWNGFRKKAGSAGFEKAALRKAAQVRAEPS
jgi:hypothetical protein